MAHGSLFTEPRRCLGRRSSSLSSREPPERDIYPWLLDPLGCREAVLVSPVDIAGNKQQRAVLQAYPEYLRAAFPGHLTKRKLTLRPQGNGSYNFRVTLVVVP